MALTRLGTNAITTVPNSAITLDAAEIPNLDTSKITTGTMADARISSSSVTQHAATTDLQPIKSDISALALREATNEASAAYNLPNQFIETFTDDTNLGTQTTVDRTSGYVSSIYSAQVYNTVALQSQRSDTVQDRPNDFQQPYSGGWTGSITNDSVRRGDFYANNWHENACKANYLYDLADDFRVRIFNVHYSTGAKTVGDYTVYAGLLTPDTSATAGASSGVLRSNEFEHSGGKGWAGDPVRFGDENITAAYATTIGSDALTDNYGANTALNLDANNLAIFWEQYNSDTNKDQWGIQVDYDASANTLITKIASNSAFTTFHANTITTVTNVPTAGRYVCFLGENSSGYYSDALAFSTTFASMGATDGGFVTETNASATGTLIQSANVVGSAKTKVGGTILYKDNAGTNTLGTDLKIYFTCNGDAGSPTWTEASSYNAITPVYSTGIKQVRLGETTCTSGTDIRYKVVWANQASGSKEAHLHGIGVNY